MRSKPYSSFNNPPYSGEVNSGEKVTETAGYIPAKIQIENMIFAGQRLANHRKEMYDFSEQTPVDEEFYDPTRAPGFDLADAHQLNEQVNSRLKEASKRRLADLEAEKNKPVIEKVETENV